MPIRPPRLCWEFYDLRTPWGPLKLEQHGADGFRVTYGRQVLDGLTYRAAAAELGAAVMHRLALDSHLDNRSRGEAKRDGAGFPSYVPPPSSPEDQRAELVELRRRIGAFRLLCEDSNQTDTGAAWELLDDIEDALKRL